MVAESVIEQQRREFGGSPAAGALVQASGNYQPYLQAGLTVTLQLIGNIILGQPVLFNPSVGQRIFMVLVQDGTGSRTVAWSSCWRDIPTGLASGGSAGQVASAEFVFDGFSWQYCGGSSAFASPGVAITTGTAQLSLAGSTPVPYANPAPTTGSAAFSGVAPTIIRSTSTVITPTVGAATMAGVAGSLGLGIAPPASPGFSLVLAGQLPGIAHL